MNNSPMPSSFDGNTDFKEESRWEKFTRRIKEEPLVPFGCAVTCVALYMASRSIRRRESHKTNQYFRYRIYAQAFTLLCVYGGSVYYADDRKKRREVEGAVAEQKAAEKRALWIKELEARDRDDREARKQRAAALGGYADESSGDPDLAARREAMAKMDADTKSRKLARGEAGDQSSPLTDPSKPHRPEGVARAVLEHTERKKTILELIGGLR